MSEVLAEGLMLHEGLLRKLLGVAAADMSFDLLAQILGSTQALKALARRGGLANDLFQQGNRPVLIRIRDFRLVEVGADGLGFEALDNELASAHSSRLVVRGVLTRSSSLSSFAGPGRRYYKLHSPAKMCIIVVHAGHCAT
jgi:hypothetical protein